MNILGKIMTCDQPALLMLDSQGMKQFMDCDLEGDAAILFEANFVPPSSRSIRDDCVASTVTRDDVQVVCLSVPFNKPVTDKLNVLSYHLACRGFPLRD